ncbi:isoprenylcysteine carboxylmethyltransferase family protein [Actinoplanes sichuanensis]|uniref:Methyltransferase family protein n=1 Tax=Actinoplanes sichuanensis TaxID=512349 RepID=A0ABW4ARM6_9ACTN|nr:isoprenylcysteine carboxylmethyltransferase family protein [Actinoplanes sichuanensis]BEL07459.1 isoprenylcysteine carboxylmethyltransferase family protein [Actinoplanes sichuanensis]
MAWLAFALYLTGVLTAFGLRTWLHRRRTGDTGHRPTRPPAGTAAWWAQILMAAGLVGGLAAPLLDAVGVIDPIPALTHTGTQLTGLIIAAAGFLGVLAAQQAMGASWRIGVDAAERTTLVTGGIFGLVRNPVFTAMITATAGVTAMTPTWAQLPVLAAVIAGIELQVRVVEEPYLQAMHGAACTEYHRRTGRFLPRFGRATTHPA